MKKKVTKANKQKNQDCERFLKVERMFERPLRNQLKMADIALLNKIDTVPPEDITAIEGELRKLGYDGPTARINGDTGEGIEAFTEVLGI